MSGVVGRIRIVRIIGALVVAVLLAAGFPARAAEAPSTIGLVNPASGEWHVQLADGSTNSFFFGIGADVPIVGDWDCDGVSSPGMWRQSDGFAYLRNSNSTGTADIQFHFGIPGDIPLAGDFNGDGCDSLAVYRGGQVFVSEALGANNSSFVADFDYWFGVEGDRPFVGDFDADGIDTIGLHRISTGLVYFTNTHGNGGTATTDASFIYGDPQDVLVSGDWTSDGVDTVGIWRADDTSFYLNFANELAAADQVIVFGDGAWVPVADNFTGEVLYPPTAEDDEALVEEGGTLSGDVVANDSANAPARVNELPSSLSAELRTEPAHGVVVLNPDGSFTYTHDGSENHLDGFSYVAVDSEGQSNVAVVAITIAPVNDNAPAGTDQSMVVDEGSVMAVAADEGLLSDAVDADVPASTLEAELVDPVKYGELTLNPDGSYVYAHDDSENHADSFTFRIFDGINYSDTQSVAITIEPLNDNAPTGLDWDRPLAATEGGTLTATGEDSLLAGAEDLDLPADTLSVAIFEDPTYGEVVVLDDGGFIYYHDGTENHEDGFSFVISDGENESEPLSAGLTITPINDNLPVGTGSGYGSWIFEGETLSVEASEGVLATASDGDLPADELAAVLIDDAEHGELSLNDDGSFTYAHDDSENHSDGFSFRVTDGLWTSTTHYVSIVVKPNNDNAPETFPESYGDVAETGILEIDGTEGVLANDTDSDVPDDELTAVLVDGPSLAEEFTLSDDGGFTYDFDESGEAFEDSFSYQAFDGINYSTVETVTISVTPENDNAPVGDDDAGTVAEGGTLESVGSVLDNDSDDDLPVDYTLTAVEGEGPDYGTLILNSDGTYSYTHDGSENHEDSFAYQASDGELNSEPTTVALTITPVNDPPAAGDASGEVEENAAVGTIVATVSVEDPDDTSHTFTIESGDDDGKFSVDADGNVKTAAGIDFEIDAISYTLSISAADGEPLSHGATVSVTVQDVNEAPTLTVGATYDVDENSPASTPINGDTPVAADVDAGDSLSYTITAGSEYVSIDEVTGALSVSAPADHETDPTVSVDVTVTDLEGLSDTETITVTINDVEEVPEIENQAISIEENSPNTTVVDTVVAGDPEELPLAFGFLSGNDDGIWAIDSVTGGIKVADSSYLDFEAFPSSYELEVQVTDAAALFSTAIVTVNIDDVNEGPSIVAGLAYDIDENSPLETVVNGAPFGVVDVDAGDTHTYAIAGGTAAVTIDPDTGVLSVTDPSLLDFEGLGNATVTVTVTDSGELSDSATVTLVVNDANDAPEITVGTAYSVEENSPALTPVAGDLPTVVDQDLPGDSHTYSITGGSGASMFDIDETTGAMTVKTGAILDSEATPTVSVEVTVTDSGAMTDAATIEVDILDANDAPELTLGAAYDVDENLPSASPVNGDTPTASDQDGDTLAFGIAGGTGLGLFDIDSVSGALTTASAFDHEATDSYTLDIAVSDGTAVTSAVITVNIGDVNEGPSIAEDQVFEIPFDAVNLDVVASVEASDPDDGDVLSYGIIDGNPNGVFTILSNGIVRIADSSALVLDDIYILTIKVTDSGDLVAEETVRMLINRSPAIDDQSFGQNENPALGETVGYLAASDPDGHTLAYSVIGGTGSSVLAVDPASGEIRVTDPSAFDFEVAPALYTLQVMVNDGGADDLSDTAFITVSEGDINEAPAMMVEVLNVDENDTVVNGTMPEATDIDAGDGQNWSITPGGTGDGLFSIDPASGAISATGPFDYETTASYTLIVRVTDDGGPEGAGFELFDEETVTININDVNETPVMTVEDLNVDENTTVVNGTQPTATDVDAGDGQTWNKQGGDGFTLFNVDPATGTISAIGPFDYETKTSYNLLVRVTDNGGPEGAGFELFHDQTVTININDLNDEAPVMTVAGLDVDENTTVVGGSQPSALDADAGDTQAWAIVPGGTGDGLFGIDGANGVVSAIGPFDFETAVSYTLFVRITDGAGNFDQQTVTINVNDLNDEAPVMTVAILDVDEDSTVVNGIQPSAIDTDAGDTQAWTKQGGDGVAHFDVDPSTGAITALGPFDYESKTSYSLLVRVTDGAGNLDEETVTININDVAEGSAVVLEIATLQTREIYVNDVLDLEPRTSGYQLDTWTSTLSSGDVIKVKGSNGFSAMKATIDGIVYESGNTAWTVSQTQGGPYAPVTIVNDLSNDVPPGWVDDDNDSLIASSGGFGGLSWYSITVP